MKAAAASVVAGAWSALGSREAKAAASDGREISVAGYDYDRIRAIADGRAGIPGSKVVFEEQNVYALNGFVFGPERKYAVSEVGLIPYVTKYVNEDFRAYTLIPVFISRIFRHRNLFVHTDAGISGPADLRGKRIGIPGYGSSAATWIRGLLQDEYGVKPDEMEWIETTKSSDDGPIDKDGGFSAFGGEKSPYFLPEGFPLSPGPAGMDESELLMSGKCDALIAPITPKAFVEGDPKIKQLFPDARAAEQAYFKKTGVFPIMHVVSIRNDAIEADPSLPKAVFDMYEKAKQAAYSNLATTTALKVTLPWAGQELADTRELMGEDYWRYGIESNKKELDLIMRYTHEQGLVRERRGFEEMFHASTV